MGYFVWEVGLSEKSPLVVCLYQVYVTSFETHCLKLSTRVNSLNASRLSGEAMDTNISAKNETALLDDHLWRHSKVIKERWLFVCQYTLEYLVQASTYIYRTNMLWTQSVRHTREERRTGINYWLHSVYISITGQPTTLQRLDHIETCDQLQLCM